MPHLKKGLLALSLLALVALTGCDLAGNEGDGSVDTLISDAQIARQNGDHARAVELMERAYEQDPDNPEVRIVYASALLDRDDVNIMDVARIAEAINAESGAPFGDWGTASRGQVCSFGPADGADLLDPQPAAIPGYAELLAHRATVQFVAELIESLLPAAVHDVALCGVIREDGTLADYPRAAVVAEIHAVLAEAGLSSDYADDLLLVYGVTLLVENYFDLFEDAPASALWFGLDPVNGRATHALGYCVEETDLAALQAGLEEPVEHVGRAVIALDLIAFLNGPTTPAAEYVDDTARAWQALRQGLVGSCQ